MEPAPTPCFASRVVLPWPPGARSLLGKQATEVIRKVTSERVVTTLAGSVFNQGWQDGAGTEAWFNAPNGVAVDSAGNVYVADTGNSVIRKVTSTGMVTTVAGTAGSCGSADGTGAEARFNQPTGITMDGTGNLFVTDTLNHTIRRITPTGAVTTLAGLAGVMGTSDGVAADALFNHPGGITVDGSGTLFVADTGNSSLRKILTNGTVSTLAGLPTISGLKDGTGTTAWFNQPLACASMPAAISM